MNATTESLLREIYGEVPAVLAEGIARLMRSGPAQPPSSSLWSERDVVLITYADQIHDGADTPLSELRSFLLDHALDSRLSCVHLLPFCPYSSDDGFSVIDYLAVDPESGTWEDIDELGRPFDLMFDLVLNHCSQHHEWFKGFLRGEPACENFFIDQDPSVDLSGVVRPRSLPLLTPFETSAGTKHVWTTFSGDQVDLNYENPNVMLAMAETLVQYAQRGARIIRLDAIAYLWKEVGTPCIHHPKTHAVVRLLRHVLDAAAPGTLILTETNVPHDENISYFGSGDDEAHMVYQFSLPPLLLDAIHSRDTSVLRDWLGTLEPVSPQTTFFNFTASHDGIGVRPLEGIVSDERVAALADVVRKHGGRVSTRRKSDGSDSPYELNIALVDAVADANTVSTAEHSRRFLATQAIMLSMQGVPAVYFHSLVGTQNDLQGLAQSGENRRINRHKYSRRELEDLLAEPDSLQRRIFDGYRRLLEVRRTLSAFHPSASQKVLDLSGDGLLGLVRTSDSGDRVVVLANLTDQPREISLEGICDSDVFDALAMESVSSSESVPVRPFQVRWLAAT